MSTVFICRGCQTSGWKIISKICVFVPVYVLFSFENVKMSVGEIKYVFTLKKCCLFALGR